MLGRTFLTAGFAVLAGCGHGEPFRAPDPLAQGPLVPGAVARLTYSAGRDQSPSWRPDGSGILYTFEQVDRPKRDWCIGWIPSESGSRTASWCEPAHADTLFAYDWAAEGPDGSVAFLRSATYEFAVTAGDFWILVAPGGDLTRSARVADVGRTLPGGPTVNSAEQLRWLDATRLVWVAQRRFVGKRCRVCLVDTTASGRLLLVLDVPGGGVSALPGTDYATSVAVRGPGAIVFTRGGDSRAFEMDLGSGTTGVLHDFGPGRTARDLQVAGDRLLAVVGGVTTFAYDSAVGDTVQVDSGGDLMVVDLSTGAETPVPLPFLVRYPALTPDGRRAVVETAVRPEDLYLVVLP